MVQEDIPETEDKEPEQMRKLFIGGLDYRTTDESLRTHFEKYGEIQDVVVMKDPKTKRSRGFGFVAFTESDMVDKAQNARPHVIDGRSVDTKRAIPRDEMVRPEKGDHAKKVFVGGITEDTQEDDLREVFSSFGEVVSVTLPIDSVTQRKRGFAFVEFQDHDCVDKLCLLSTLKVKGRRVEVKKALSRKAVKEQEFDGGRGDRANQWGDRQNNTGWNQNNYNSGGNASSWRDNQNWGMGNQNQPGYNPPSGGYGSGNQSVPPPYFNMNNQWQPQQPPAPNQGWNNQQGPPRNPSWDTAPPPDTYRSQPTNWGPPPVPPAGPPMTASGPPMGSRPPMDGGPPMTSGPPTGSSVPPMGASGPPMGSSGPPMTSYGPPVASGLHMGSSAPPMGTSGPPVGSSGPPMGASGPPMGASGPPMGASGPPMGSVGPHGTSGPPMSQSGLPSSGPSMPPTGPSGRGQDNYGNSYMQGYGGGPMRVQPGYGSNRPSPYNTGSGAPPAGSFSYGGYGGGGGSSVSSDRRY